MQLQTFLSAALAITGASAGTTPLPSLIDVISGDKDLSTLYSVLGKYPDLVKTLSTASCITVFAPCNAAFEAVDKKLLEDYAFVEALLTYHVVHGDYPAEAFKETPQFPHTFLTNTSCTTVTGGQVVELKLEGKDAQVISGEKKVSTVTKPNIHFKGGVAHVISNVLTIPKKTSETLTDENLTALLGSVQTTQLTETLDTTPDLTIFAPSNAAFQALGTSLNGLSTDAIKDILLYHVIKGTVGYSSTLKSGKVSTLLKKDVTITVGSDGVLVNDAKVVIVDVLIANGVAHVIDKVLNPNPPAHY